MTEREFKSELDGMAAAARERRNRGVSGPSLDEILKVAGDYVKVALLQGIFCRGEKPAFRFGDDRTIWHAGWPIGEWVSRGEMFSEEPADDLIAIRIFDPNVRESLHWFVKSADRRKYDAEMNQPRKLSNVQREREQVEKPLAEHRGRLGHLVERQVICGAGRIDILDVTANEIIECKASGSGSDIVAAVNQLRRYAQHYSNARLTVAVPYVEEDGIWLAELIEHIGIAVIEVDRGF
jgi:hypothetical protein